jgi:hypothetical protein
VGVRTLIVNDLGLLATLARAHPALRLTASIGCGAQTPGDVAAVADLGAAAVVLPATIDPDDAGACAAAAPIAVEIMVHMVEEFVLLGRCAMPGYFQLRPTPLPDGAPADRRQSGSMKRGGVGACFKVASSPGRSRIAPGTGSSGPFRRGSSAGLPTCPPTSRAASGS